MYSPQIGKPYTYERISSPIIVTKFHKGNLEETCLEYKLPGTKRTMSIKGYEKVCDFLDELTLIEDVDKEIQNLESAKNDLSQQLEYYKNHTVYIFLIIWMFFQKTLVQ